MTDKKKKTHRHRMIKEKVGGLEKVTNSLYGEEFLDYLEEVIEDYDFKHAYDVTAGEPLYFKTVGFTEFANCMLLAPLQPELRAQQMREAYLDDVAPSLDFISFFKKTILEKDANKYSNVVDDPTISPGKRAKKVLVALPGDNKLKKHVSMKKLRFIEKKYKGDFLIKPHPMTNFKTIGELMDAFGEDSVTLRGDDLYRLLIDSEILCTTGYSESAMYAVSLNKKVEPIDNYDLCMRAGFYHINKFLFHEKDPQTWVNRTFNSPKSGIICPLLDPNWKITLRKYLDYIESVRDYYKDKYL